jgi:hypothetical protein
MQKQKVLPPMENQNRAKQSPGAAEWMVSSFFILPSAF